MNTLRPSQEIYTRHDVEGLKQSELDKEVVLVRNRIENMDESVEGQQESSQEIDHAVKVRIERSRQDGELVEKVVQAAEIMQEDGEYVPGLLHEREVKKMQASLESR